MEKGIASLEIPKSDKKGDVKYLVQVLNKNEQGLPLRVGFIGASCPICVQYFDGTEKDVPKEMKGLRQMPKVFNKKEDANKAIKEAKEMDVAFKNTDVLYELVPIEIYTN